VGQVSARLQLFTGLSLRRLKYPGRFFWTFLAG
jgi:hypothetical protein